MADQSDSSGHILLSSQAKQAASIIHVSRTLPQTEFLKLPNIASEGEVLGTTSEDPDNLRRREFLARRPSYRKLYNDLTGDQHGYVISKIEDNSSDGQLTQDSNDNSNDATGAISQTFQIVSQEDGTESGLRTLAVGGIGSGNVPTSGTTVIQYTQGPDGGQYFIPVQQLSPSRVVSFPQSIMVAGGVGLNNGQQVMEEASRKRELRLLKNKEAAKECRRKKKEYVKCLENRVAVLENQNKTLIEELKSLKELYCQKEVQS